MLNDPDVFYMSDSIFREQKYKENIIQKVGFDMRTFNFITLQSIIIWNVINLFRKIYCINDPDVFYMSDSISREQKYKENIIQKGCL